jgi:hypothetical protein
VRYQHDEGDDSVTNQGEPPVDQEHANAERDKCEKVAQSGHHTGSEQLVQGFHIRRHARDETSNRIAIEKGDWQPLEVRKNPETQVAHHPLAKGGRQPGFTVRTEELRYQSDQEQDARRDDQTRVLRRDRNVDDTLCEDWPYELQRTFDAQQGECPRHEQLIRLYVGQQPSHQLAIVGLA